MLLKSLSLVAAALFLAAPSPSHASVDCSDPQESIFGPGDGLGARDLCGPELSGGSAGDAPAEGARAAASRDEPRAASFAIEWPDRSMDAGG